jgi:hypothetical protein
LSAAYAFPDNVFQAVPARAVRDNQDIRPVSIYVASQYARNRWTLVSRVPAGVKPGTPPLKSPESRWLAQAEAISPSALDRIHDTGELGEHAVAGGIDESSVMLLDERIDQLAM